MRVIEGDFHLELFHQARLTCGHIILIDAHSGPADDIDLPEALIYCIKCGSAAQISKLKNTNREIQVVSDWDITHRNKARDFDPKRENVQLRTVTDPTAGVTPQPDSPGAGGVPGEPRLVDAPKGATARRTRTKRSHPDDLLAP